MILVYGIKLLVSTVLIYLSIQIADSGNYRNKLSTAFITALVISLAEKVPFIFFLSLLVWLYILINWYNIGFFRSFFCVIVYTILLFLLSFFVTGTVISARMLYSKIAQGLTLKGINLSELKKRIPSIEGAAKLIKKQDGDIVTIIFNDGGEIKGRIKNEDNERYLVDIAESGSEVVIPKNGVKEVLGYVKGENNK